MSLSLIKINYKTNFNQYPNSYPTDASTFRTNTSITYLIQKYNEQLPTKTFLFTDAFPLSNSDYPSDDTDFLTLLKNPYEFWNLLENKKKTYKKRYGKDYKITVADKKKLGYKEHNLKYIIERLFKLGTKIYLPGRDKFRPVTITNFRYIPYNDAFDEGTIYVNKVNKSLPLLTVNLDLELDDDIKGSVGMDKLKKYTCDQRLKRISNIYNKLKGKDSKGFKKTDIKKMYTPGMYNVSSGGSKKKKYKKTRKRRYKKKRKYKVSKCHKRATRKYNLCNKRRKSCWNRARRTYKNCKKN